LVGSVSLPSQKPGPGRLVTTESVSATTGLNLAASRGTAPQVAFTAGPVVAEVLAAFPLPLLPHAESAAARATVEAMTPSLRVSNTTSET
jgi:hypothetical protein